MAAVVFSAITNSANSPSDQELSDYNDVLSAFVFTSLATTVFTTFLIGYRIHTVACMNGSRSKRRLNHVMTMILESAAINSLMLIGIAISTVIPSFADVGSPGFVVSYYIESVVNVGAVRGPNNLVALVSNPDDGKITSREWLQLSL